MPYNAFITDWKKNKQKLVKNHVYDELNEHSSCGVGLIASLKSTPKREVVEMGIEALKVLYHRGAVDADGKSGDGAGIHIDIPKQYFIEQISFNFIFKSFLLSSNTKRLTRKTSTKYIKIRHFIYINIIIFLYYTHLLLLNYKMLIQF